MALSPSANRIAHRNEIGRANRIYWAWIKVAERELVSGQCVPALRPESSSKNGSDGESVWAAWVARPKKTACA